MGSSDGDEEGVKAAPSGAAATRRRRQARPQPDAADDDPATQQARMLTRRLSRCGSTAELADLVAASSASMNSRHAAAALHALSRCAEREGLLLSAAAAAGPAGPGTAAARASAAAAARVLLGVFDQQLESASASDLAVALGAAARLRIRPPAQTTAEAAAAATAPTAPNNKKKRRAPPAPPSSPTFVDRVLARALSLDPRDCSARDLATLLWAAARLGHDAAPGAVSAVAPDAADPLGAFPTGVGIVGGVSGGALSAPSTLRILAAEDGAEQEEGSGDGGEGESVGGAPGWMAALMEELLDRHASLTPFELAVLPWAAAKLGYLPPQAWLRRYWSALCGGGGVVTTATATPATPPPPASSNNPGASRIPELGPSHLAMLLWGAAVLGARPPPNALDALVLEAHVKMPAFAARGLASLGWALARMDARPGAAWRADYVRALRAALPGMRGSDQAFSNAAWALASWRHGPPPRAFCEEFCRGAARELGGAEPRALAALVGSVAEWLPASSSSSSPSALGYVPPLEWPTRALRRMSHARARAGAQDLVLALDGVARLVVACVAAEAGGGRGGGDAATATSVLAAWRAENGAHVQALAQALLPALRPPPRAAGIYGGGRGERGGGAMAPPTAAARLSPPELVAVAAALASLGHFPGEAFMDAHEAAVNASILELDAHDVQALRDAYAALEAASLGGSAAAAPGGSDGAGSGAASASGGRGGSEHEEEAEGRYI